MMNDNDLKNWLVENGGLSVQLQINMELSDNESTIDNKNTVAKLLNIEEVNIILNYLDAFKIQSRDKKTLEHLIHYYKETCIENFFPRLLDLGFRAGIPVFDEKMEPVRELYSNLIFEYYGYSLMMTRFFFMASYTYPEIIEAMKRRINAIHQVAKEKVFDIYQDKNKLPKVPEHWADLGVLKDEFNPFREEKPLPVIYDIAALAYFPQSNIDLEIQEKIDDIIKYILDPRFQAIPEGYGLLWVKSRRIYHACGWSPTLPCYENYIHSLHYDIYCFLYYFDIMSKFKLTHDSKWFKDCLKHIEQFKTEKGTYIFPKEYLNRKYIAEAILNDSNMKLKRNEREIRIRELMSTLYMLKIKNRVACHTH